MDTLPSGTATGGGSGSTILLVEDNDAVRQALTDILRLLGYHVIAACCGEAAVKIVRQITERIALVISDLVLPGMNALQLYEALGLEPGRDKMLIITAYPMPYAGLTIVEKPGVQWARKPISMDELERVVSEMLAG